MDRSLRAAVTTRGNTVDGTRHRAVVNSNLRSINLETLLPVLITIATIITGA